MNHESITCRCAGKAPDVARLETTQANECPCGGDCACGSDCACVSGQTGSLACSCAA
jgi:hypothetical protein